MVAAFLKRLDNLQPDSPRQWGRMSAHQMVCHLNDSFRAVVGQRDVSLAITPFSRTVMKWVAMNMPVPWPKGVPTRPEIAQDKGGSPPVEWSQDVAELRSWIAAFPARDRYGTHPMFGEMNRKDWLIWAYRHMDHHFRQFGV